MPLSASEILTRDFLEIRARLLEVAAALDRIDRAEGDVSDDARMARIRQAIARLEVGQSEGGASDRAEQLQLVFSLNYEPGWLPKLKTKS
jgi:hypothetical protein